MIDNIYTDNDIDITFLNSINIAVIGYGNQGRAHALNLFDSDISVKVGLRRNSKNIPKVLKDGLEYLSIKQAVQWADIICILIPDQDIAECFNNNVKPYLETDQTILFAHGYNIHFKLITPPKTNNVVMVAPSGPGEQVRNKFITGSGIPNLVAIHNDYSGNSKEIVLAYSKAIGGSRTGTFFSTFKEETETDLFGEQVLLTGGLPKLIQTTFDVLVESGYSPVTAWFVSYYEIKSMIDMFYDKGFEFMNNAISDTAEYGGVTRGNRIISENVKNEMRSILKEIQTGDFHAEWMKVSTNSCKEFEDIRKKERELPINSVSNNLLSQLLKFKK